MWLTATHDHHVIDMSITQGNRLALGYERNTTGVTIPFATTRRKTHFGVRPTLDEWKKAFDRNIALYVNANDRSTGIELKSPTDRLVCNRRIAARMNKEQSHVQACEMEVADMIWRLVSAEGGTEWEYDIQAEQSESHDR